MKIRFAPFAAAAVSAAAFAVFADVPAPDSAAPPPDDPELCPGGICPVPEDLFAGGGPESAPPPADSAARPVLSGGAELPTLDDFEVVRTIAGDPGAEEFAAFLRGKPAKESAFETALRRGGAPLLAAALILAGLLLNLTPCTLPLVPVNLALLGVGAGRSSRGRGALVGAAFGAGMAVCYGALGLVASRTGRTFGAIHGSAAFSAVVSAVFALLSLASLGVFRVDFSALRNLLPRRKRRTAAGGANLAAAFAAGAGSAVLAGACVAPALVSALVLSADLSGRGVKAGALVPFALGLGMALPWPLLGAGVAALPKPGRWTERVKQLFAAVFAAAAAAYLARAWNLQAPGNGRSEAESGIAWLADETAAAVVSVATGKPLLVDFTADWCSACGTMDKGTLSDRAVRAALDEIHGPALLRVDCTDSSSPEVRRVFERFSVPGLPFFAILRPKGRDGEAR